MNIKLSQSRPRFLHHLASHHSPSSRLCLADTMYVYNGFNYVENECCTLVFPAGFALKDPQALCAYWQLIVSLGLSAQSLRPPNSTNAISFDFYAFDAVIPDDFKSVTVTMLNPNGETVTSTLMAQLTDPVRILSTEVWQAELVCIRHIRDGHARCSLWHL